VVAARTIGRLLTIVVSVAASSSAATAADAPPAAAPANEPVYHPAPFLVLPSVMTRNGDLLTGTAALLVPWRVTCVGRNCDRRALRVEAGVGIGGVHASVGAWREIDCNPGPPLCGGAFLVAEILRTAWESPWEHRTYWGVDAGVNITLVKLALGAVARTGETSPIAWRASIGLGW
jgi:hypothetical protein